MTAQIADDGTIVTDLMKKGRPWKKEMTAMKRHVLDYYVASNYSMNWDGTTTGHYNHLTEAQFNKLMSRIKRYAA